MSSAPGTQRFKEEERVQQALSAVINSGLTPRGLPYLSLRAAARDFEVSRSKLTARWNGRTSRQVGRETQQILTPPQEQVLVEWVKVLARRATPMSSGLITDKASAIAGHDVGKNWIYRFRARHPCLKARWTAALESCRAGALNRPLVLHFYKLLRELREEFEILPENEYNMDEKGVQLGIGTRARVLVDREQKNVHQIQDGDREMVTMIETVCADGTSLKPMAIFKGLRTNAMWGADNPLGMSIASSPNGWTDKELGYTWLKREFEPQTKARNPTNGFRLLILDGHNSHCSYSFIHHAELHRIIVLCLPPHTTHRLQPCDVGVFGPLSQCWAKEVNILSRAHDRIRKDNVLGVYARARNNSFKHTTLTAAWRKTGIWPLDPEIIESDAYAPATNTTTQAAQPIPTALPECIELQSSHSIPEPQTAHKSHPTIVVISPTGSLIAGTINTPTGSTSSSSASLAGSSSSQSSHTSIFTVRGLPQPLRESASRILLQDENRVLRRLLLGVTMQVEADHAQKVLMDDENGRLRQELYTKSTKNGKRKVVNTFARHMTAPEIAAALAKDECKRLLALVFVQAGPRFKVLRATCIDFEKEARERAKQEEKELLCAAKEIAKATKQAKAALDKAHRDAEKALITAEKKAEKDAEQAHKLKQKALLKKKRETKAAEKAAEKAEKAVERAEKAAEKAQKAAEKEMRKAEKAAEKETEESDEEIVSSEDDYSDEQTEGEDYSPTERTVRNDRTGTKKNTENAPADPYPNLEVPQDRPQPKARPDFARQPSIENMPHAPALKTRQGQDSVLAHLPGNASERAGEHQHGVEGLKSNSTIVKHKAGTKKHDQNVPPQHTGTGPDPKPILSTVPRARRQVKPCSRYPVEVANPRA